MLIFIISLGFILLSLPIWVIIGLIKGFIDFLIFLASNYFWVFQQNFLVEYKLPVRDTFAAIFTIPFMAFWDGLKGSSKPLKYLWNFSNENPYISLIVSGLLIFNYLLLIKLSRLSNGSK